MEEEKISEEEQKAQEEEYSFLQETIKNETGNRKKLRNDILRVIGLGFVFGLVACFSFYAFRPWVREKVQGGPAQVTIPEEEEEEGQEKEEEGQDRPVLDTDSYRQMLQSLKGVAEETGKSVVEITGTTGTEKQDFTRVASQNENSVSGVIIADNGRELLVLGQILPKRISDSIRVTFADGKSYSALVKRLDKNLGLCIYAVERDEIRQGTWMKIRTAVLGSSNSVEQGDTAIVLGKPFGYANAVSYGIVAADKAYKDFPDGQYSIVYTDIAGSSAGSGILANIRGEVIGIVAQTVLEEDSRNLIAGYGISDIKELVERLSNGEGVPYIGMYVTDVTEEMQEQGLPKGVYVQQTDADSPAMAAGIQSGDIITGMDGREIVTQTAYHSVLMDMAEGEKVTFKGKRPGAGDEYVDIDFAVTVGTKE